MIKTISPDLIGHPMSLYDAAPIIAAQAYFAGYFSSDIRRDTAQGKDRAKELFDACKLRPMGFTLPVECGSGQKEFDDSFASLDQLAALAGRKRRIGQRFYVPAFEGDRL
jgi:hypothetical protein